MAEKDGVIWEKHDALKDEVNDLKTTSAVHENRLNQHDDQFRKMNLESSERHGQVMGAITQLEKDHSERKGATKSQNRTVWIVGALLAAAMAVIELFGTP